MEKSGSGFVPAGIPPYRDEDERRREVARQGALESTVDELRQGLRELASRQVRLEETIKSYEAMVAQNRQGIDQIRQESQVTAKARAIDENRTRQQVSDLDQRLDDAVRPVRSLQAHVSELLEASRKKVDDSGQLQRRIDETKTSVDHLQAVTDRNTAANHAVRESVEVVRGELDQVRRDILRNEDAVKIVDQDVRRRIAEIAQLSEGVNNRIDELRSDIGHSLALIEDLRRSITHVDPTLEELKGVDVEVRQEIERVATQAVERHEVVVDRLDDLRRAQDDQVTELRSSLEQRFERLNARIDDVIEEYRDVGVRVGSVFNELETLKLADESARREMWSLHEQRVRLRLEQAQQELDQVSGLRRSGGERSPATPSQNISERPADR